MAFRYDDKLLEVFEKGGRKSFKEAVAFSKENNVPHEQFLRAFGEMYPQQIQQARQESGVAFLGEGGYGGGRSLGSIYDDGYGSDGAEGQNVAPDTYESEAEFNRLTAEHQRSLDLFNPQTFLSGGASNILNESTQDFLDVAGIEDANTTSIINSLNPGTIMDQAYNAVSHAGQGVQDLTQGDLEDAYESAYEANWHWTQGHPGAPQTSEVVQDQWGVPIQENLSEAASGVGSVAGGIGGPIAGVIAGGAVGWGGGSQFGAENQSTEAGQAALLGAGSGLLSGVASNALGPADGAATGEVMAGTGDVATTTLADQASSVGTGILGNTGADTGIQALTGAAGTDIGGAVGTIGETGGSMAGSDYLGPLLDVAGEGLGAYLENEGLNEANDLQKEALDNQLALNREVFSRAEELNAPFLEASNTALDAYQNLDMDGYGMRIGEELYDMDFNDYLAAQEQDPYYDWRVKQQEEAINRQLAARGGYGSREGLNILGDQQQQMSADEYDRRYGRATDRYTSDQARYGTLFDMDSALLGRRQGQLTDLISTGQNATNSILNAGAGMASNSSTAFSNAADAMGNISATQGNNYAGLANSIGGAYGNYQDDQYMQQLMNSFLS